MAKSKYAPALFEVINSQRKERERLAVPKWFKRAQMASQGVGERSAASAAETRHPNGVAGHEDEAIAKPLNEPTGTDEGTAGGSSASTGSDRPAIAWRGKLPLVQFSADGVAMFFNPMNVAVTVGVLLLALFVSFLAGMAVQSRSRAAIPDPNGTDALLNQPATPGVLGASDGGARSTTKTLSDRPPTSAPSGEARAGAASDGSRREAGVNLILIETFGSEHKKSAEAVQEWFASEYGLETRLERSAKGWRLLTVKGFDYREPAAEQAARAFCEQVKEQGEQCARELARKRLPVYRLNSPMPVRAEK